MRASVHKVSIVSKSRRDAIKHQIDTLESAIKEWSAKALSLSQRLAEYNRIKASFDRSKGLYDRLVNNLHDVDVTRNVDQDLVSVWKKLPLRNRSNRG